MRIASSHTGNFVPSCEILSLVYIRECTTTVVMRVSTTSINYDVRVQLTLPSFREFCIVRDPCTGVYCSLLVALPLQSFLLRGNNPRPSFVPWARDEDRGDLSPGAGRRDAAVAADGVADAQGERNPRRVYPAFGPGELFHGG